MLRSSNCVVGLLICSLLLSIQAIPTARDNENQTDRKSIPSSDGMKSPVDVHSVACSSPVALGMENNNIPDSAITASSFTNKQRDFYGPQLARLNLYPLGPWIKRANDEAAWIQVDLGDELCGTVTGLQTQGAGETAMTDKYVSAFKVRYGIERCNLDYVGAPTMFTAISSAVTTHTFPEPVQARIIRIEPTTCEEVCALRFEVFGCPELSFTGRLATQISTNLGSASAIDGDTNPMFAGNTCTQTDTSSLTPAVCSTPVKLGIENGQKIKAALLTASSDAYNFVAQRGRLNGPYCWKAHFSEITPWIQVDLFETSSNAVSGVITQGAPGQDEWATSFSVQVGEQVCSLQYIMGSDNAPKNFPANSDKSTEVTNMFPSTYRARYVRVYLVQWKKYPSLRFEVLGCRL